MLALATTVVLPPQTAAGGVLPPSLTKSFSPTTISSGSVAVLTFTVLSSASNPPVSDVGFVDNLPAKLQVANPAGVGGTCSNASSATNAVAGGTSITVSNLNVPAGPAACTVIVNITNKPGNSGTCPDVQLTNSSSNVTVSNVANGIQPSCLEVMALVSPSPTATETATPSPSATATGTATPSASVTRTETRVPDGGSCMTGSECLSLYCVDGVCQPLPSAVPAVSVSGLMIGVGVLIGLGAIALWRQRTAG
jgi:hypothetical protein